MVCTRVIQQPLKKEKTAMLSPVITTITLSGCHFFFPKSPLSLCIISFLFCVALRASSFLSHRVINGNLSHVVKEDIIQAAAYSL